MGKKETVISKTYIKTDETISLYIGRGEPLNYLLHTLLVSGPGTLTVTMELKRCPKKKK